MAHCCTCHKTFGSVKSFDRHRTNEECTHPNKLGLTYNETRKAWTQKLDKPIVPGWDSLSGRNYSI